MNEYSKANEALIAEQGLLLSPDGALYLSADHHAELVELRERISGDRDRLLEHLRSREVIGPDEALPIEILGDVKLTRFLFGHGSVDVALEFARNYVDWRLDNDIDADLRAAVHEAEAVYDFTSALPMADDFMRFIPTSFCAASALNEDILNVERTGGIEVRGLVGVSGEQNERFLRFHIAHMEVRNLRFDRITRDRTRRMQLGELPLVSGGDALAKGVSIKDLTGLSRKHAWGPGLALLKQASGVTQPNYPEQLRLMCVINVPWVFYMIWRIVRRWMNEQTLARIKIYGSGGYQEALLEHFDPAVLPEEFGGKSTETNVPHRVLHDSVADSEASVETVVGARSCHDVEVDLRDEPCRVEYVVKVEAYDIFLTLVLVRPGVEEETVAERVLLDSEKGAHDGVLTLDAGGGRLILRLDNSHSLLRSKSVRHSAIVMDLESEE